MSSTAEVVIPEQSIAGTLSAGLGYLSASCLGIPPLAPRTWGALVSWPIRGPSPFGSLARAGDLGPKEASPLGGTWQVAFLGEIEPRAARPGMHAPASEMSRTSHKSRLSIAPWPPLS